MQLDEWCKLNNKEYLLKEWGESNDNPPSFYSHGCSKYVQWTCPKGHEWPAKIYYRTHDGTGCPYCAGKIPVVGENDLATLFPNLALEWDYENNKKKPEDYKSRSGAIINWKCKKGHSWPARIYARTNPQGGTGCPYCAGQRVLPGENDLATLFPKYAKQWDVDKNSGLSASDVCAHAGNKYWWRCEYGHSWRETPNNRVSQGLGCPKCSKHLKTSFPEQAIFFYTRILFDSAINRYKITKRMEIDVYIPEIKIGIEYDGIVFHSSKRVIEIEKKKNKICAEQGIQLIRVKECRENKKSTKEIIYRNVNEKNSLTHALNLLMDILFQRTTKRCVINIEKDRNEITKLYNDVPILETDNYEVIKRERDYEKNYPVTPEMVSKGNHTEYYWRCEKGHSWRTEMYHRTDKDTSTGCPYCAGKKVLAGFNDLKSLNPKLAAEWDYEANGDLKPEEFTIKSGKKVYWKCKLGHSYTSKIAKRSSGQGCPYCSGRKVLKGFNDLATVRPELMKDWDFDKNTISPYDVTKGCNKSVYWKCQVCGYEWQSQINGRSSGKGCKECSCKKRWETRRKNQRLAKMEKQS